MGPGSKVRFFDRIFQFFFQFIVDNDDDDDDDDDDDGDDNDEDLLLWNSSPTNSRRPYFQKGPSSGSCALIISLTFF